MVETVTKPPFTYPLDFVVKVKAEYPDASDLHEALDNNSAGVGRWLNDSSNKDISPQSVLVAFNGDFDKLVELRDYAAAIIRRRKLYSEWGEIYDAYHEQ